MAFDSTDPADLLALKTEVNTDPIGMGYVPDATFYLINRGGQSLTLALDVRARGWTTA